MKNSHEPEPFPYRAIDLPPVAIAVIGVGAILTAGCGHDPPESPVEQSVAELHVEPPVLRMKAGTEALISVHALSEQGGKLYLVPEFVIDMDTGANVSSTNLLVTWSATSSTAGSVDPWLNAHPESPNQHRAILKVPANAAGTLELKAEAGGKSASAKVLLDPPTSPPQTNVTVVMAVPVQPTDGHSVRVALTDGAGGSDEVWAFQWNMDPGTLLPAGTEHVAILSDFARISTDPAPAGATVTSPTPSPPEAPYVLPARLWLATDLIFDPSDLQAIRDRIRDDLALTNELFRVNRIGILLDAGGSPGSPPPVHGFEGYEEPPPDSYLDCQDLRPRVESLQSLKPEFDQILLNVLYLPSAVNAKRGHECAIIEGKESFVAVFRDWRAPTTLAHEVAHALGLSKHSPAPISDGHTTDYYEYFDPGNLMWTGLETRQATDRNWFSLGQSLWMTMHDISQLQYAVTDPSSLTSPKVKTDSAADCRTAPECALQTLLIEKAQ